MSRVIKIGIIGIGLAFITLYGFFDKDTPSVIAATQKPKATQTKSDLQTAPDFALKDLDGKELKLSDYKGKVVVLDFWATWCYPCRLEIPHLVALQKKFEKQGFSVIGISLDQGGAETVKPFYKMNNMNYPVVIGNEAILDSYGGIRGFPTTFIINQDGKIVKKYEGYAEKIVPEIEKIIYNLFAPAKKTK